jgi:2-iminobutanoate/2-iminopropanoate deaminase
MTVAPGFSDVVCHGDLLVLAGQGPVDLPSMELVAPDIERQCVATIDRVEQLLGEHSASLSDILRIECFLARREDFPIWNRLFDERFEPPRPARTTIVTALVLEGMLIELQVIAARGRG